MQQPIKRMIDVSIIIPCYNHSSFIEKTVQSALKQTLKSVEIIIVDDGSTDGSLDIVHTFTDKRISVIAQENKGVGAARNRGIQAAQGRYIQFLDADDYIHEEKLKIQSETLDQNPDVTFALCDVQCVDAEDRESSSYSIQHIASCKNLFFPLFSGGFFPPHVPLVRKSTIIKAGLFTEDRNLSGVADYDLWLRVAAENGTFIYTDRKLAYYRDLPESMSKNIHAMEAGQEICLKSAIHQFPDISAQAIIYLRRQKEDLKAANNYLRQQLHSVTVGGEIPLINQLLRNREAPVYVWGAGSKGKEAIAFLRSIDIKPMGIIDSDKNKDGTQVEDLEILHAQRFAETKKQASPFVVVASMYADEIKASLESMGIPQYGFYN